MSLTHLLAQLPEPLFSAYSIEKVLGVGAYAVVYKIRDRRTAEAFALKVVEKEPMRIRLMLQQLSRETALLEAQAGTPHIIELLETTTTTTHVFLRFPLCQGCLEELSEEQGPMEEEEAFRWLRQACLGVQALHSAGVIHRDLKPSNFLIDLEGQLQICDFGWACYESQALTGQCGTPEYSPPETSTKGQEHTAKVDVYGLAATCQHLLLGRVPKGPQDLPKSISPSTRKLLAQAMDSDPDSRPSVDELLCRPELSQNMIAQLWNQWRTFFDITAFA
jgi:serine/threonine protein kinase